MIIGRYLAREITMPLVVVSALLIAIFVAYSLSRFLGAAADGLLSPNEVVVLTALKGLIALEVLLPVALYVALVLGLGRLHSDAETTVLRACGFGEGRIVWSVLRPALVVTLMVGLFSAFVRPWAYSTLYALQAESEAAAELDRFRPGRFYHYAEENRSVFVEAMPRGSRELRGLFVRTRDEGGLEVISSARGRVVPLVEPQRHALILEDADIYKKVRNGPDFYGRFGTLTLLIPARSLEQLEYRTKSQSTRLLRGSMLPNDRAEYQWRLSTAVSTLLLALLAVPLSRSRPRQGRYARLLPAVLIYAVYYNLLGIARSWVEQRVFEVIWWVPALLAVVVVFGYIPWSRLRRRRAAS